MLKEFPQSGSSPVTLYYLNCKMQRHKKVTSLTIAAWKQIHDDVQSINNLQVSCKQ